MNKDKNGIRKHTQALALLPCINIILSVFLNHTYSSPK